MIIRRDTYLNRLISSRGNKLIKIVTGIRRCGKSFLLSVLFRDFLKSEGVADDHIIEIALDDRKNHDLLNPDALLDHINARINDRSMYYILLDEVQMVEDFVGVLNSLLHVPNVDVYVTGSNSRFLSIDIVTEFRGRGFEIKMYPLTFAEYYSARGGDKSDCWRDYYTFGGLPQVTTINDFAQKTSYLEHLANTVFVSDVVERNGVRKRHELEELLRILSSSIGAPCNPSKISNTFRSVKNEAVSVRTINNYITYLCDAFLVSKAMRYDIKGKRYINSLSKYYFSDMGLRNALLGFRQIEESHIMENVIYNELISRGFKVDVGNIDAIIRDRNGDVRRAQYEVDFVANQGSVRYYIQSALAIPGEEKMKQESSSFRRISDSFKKVIVVGSNIMPYHNDEGFFIIGIFDFLLNPKSLEMVGYQRGVA